MGPILSKLNVCFTSFYVVFLLLNIFFNEFCWLNKFDKCGRKYTLLSTIGVTGKYPSISANALSMISTICSYTQKVLNNIQITKKNLLYIFMIFIYLTYGTTIKLFGNHKIFGSSCKLHRSMISKSVLGLKVSSIFCKTKVL